ncbi:MAG TPA: TonB-dependent receptor, partial [Woeseiaceae bacterium]|nr:TonB-dependent receptor [Woeseiaceae bacterium]
MTSRAKRPAIGLPAASGVAAVCMSALLAAPPTRAQQAPTPDEEVEQIVVTGTAGGAEILKFDASFAITTMSDEDITEYSPQSTADLLKLVPGVWSESSGGVSGANVFVRGFPGGGDAPFLTVQVNGAPIYPPPTLSFLENTTLFRIDETVLRVEALRGGPNPVFSNGQPGLTTNFILREGGEETEGLVKYTTSDYNLRRFDAYMSGPLGDDFFYMIGGYLKSSPGIRDAGFNSDEGNQFTINLTKELDNGTINVFHRQTDDTGQWYLPVALNVPGIDAEYSQLGPRDRQREILLDNASSPDFGGGGDPAAPDPERRTIDLGEGRGWVGSMTGGSVVLDITNDWQLTDRFGLTKGDADTLGLVPDGGAVQVGALLADPSADDRAVVTGPITGAVTGRPIASDEFIQQFGAWLVRKDIEAFTNDISLAYTFDRGTATFGYYAANSSSDDFWSLGNSKYEVVEKHGELVTGIECNDDPTADSCGFNFDIDGTGDATTNALYAAGTIDVTDDLRADVGVRWENHQVDYSVDIGLDGMVDFAVEDYDKSEVSWTAALNYLLNDSMGVFGRINSGNKMPYFDDFRDNQDAFNSGNDLIQDIDQYELGFKWVTDNLSLYATAFYTEVDPSFFVALVGEEAIIQTQDSTGVELDATWDT